MYQVLVFCVSMLWYLLIHHHCCFDPDHELLRSHLSNLAFVPFDFTSHNSRLCLHVLGDNLWKVNFSLYVCSCDYFIDCKYLEPPYLRVCPVIDVTQTVSIMVYLHLVGNSFKFRQIYLVILLSFLPSSLSSPSNNISPCSLSICSSIYIFISKNHPRFR